MRPFAQRIDCGIQFLRRHAGLGQNFPRLAVLLQGEGEQQPLDGDKTVAGLLAGFLGGVEDARQSRIEIDLACAAATDFRPLGERGIHRLQRLARLSAGAIDQPGGQAFRIVEQNLQQMFRGKLLVAFAQGQRLRRLNETAGAVRVFLEIHASLPRPVMAPETGRPLLGSLPRPFMWVHFSRFEGANGLI